MNSWALSWALGALGRRDDVLKAGVRARVRDVLGDAGRKQRRLLQDERELVAQVGQLVVAQIEAIQEDATGARVIEARRKLTSVVLPDPVKPAIPRRICGSTSNERLCKTGKCST
jgi:hypothetical protein